MYTTTYKPIHWVDINKLNKYHFSANPNAISLLEQNPEIIDWTALSANPNAIHLLESNLDNICWELLAFNPNAMHLLEQNPDKINWRCLSKNPAAIHLLEQNQDKIYWMYLSENPKAIHLLEHNPDKIDWNGLSMNPAAIHLLEQNPEKIDWKWLSMNPAAIHLLEQNPEKIDWKWLSKNPAAIHLLEKNQDKINWFHLSENPNIFYASEQRLIYNPNLTKQELNMPCGVDTTTYCYKCKVRSPCINCYPRPEKTYEKTISVNSHNVVFCVGTFLPDKTIYHLYKCVNCHTRHSMEDFEKEVCVPKPEPIRERRVYEPHVYTKKEAEEFLRSKKVVPDPKIVES